MFLLPLPILAPLVVKYKSTNEEENRDSNDDFKTNKKKSGAKKYFEICPDFWQKFVSFIGSPCIKYAYYFVNNKLLKLFKFT